MGGLASTGKSVDATGQHRRALRFVVIGTVALLALATVATLVLRDRGSAIVVWAIEHPVSAYVGRQLVVGGPVEVEWGAPTHLVLHDFRVANAPWAAAPALLRAAQLTVDVDPWSLVRRPIHFRRVAFAKAALSLEIAPDGGHNWPTASGAPPFIESLALDDSAITFRRDATGKTIAIDATHWQLDAAARGEPAQIALAGRLQGTPFAIKGTIGALAELRAPTGPYPVELDAAVAGGTLSVHGTVARPLDGAGVDLRVGVTGKSIAALARALDAELPPLPDFRARARVKGSAAAWALDDLDATLGASDLGGAVAIDRRGAVPRLRATLHADRLDSADLASWFPPGGAPAPQAADGRIIPALPLRPSWLGRADADIAIAAGQLRLGNGIVLHDVAGTLHAAGDVLQLDRLHVAADDGVLDGTLRIDGAARPSRVDLDIAIHHLSLQKLLADMSVPKNFKGASGIAGGFARLGASGDTLRAALGDMNGQAAVFAENGRLTPALQQFAAFDLLRTLGLAGDSGDVPARCLIGVYDMADGIATSRATLLDTPDALSVGAGNFNFRDETIVFDITPFAKRTNFDALAPIEVRGTFAEPTLGPRELRFAGRIASSLAFGALPFVDLGLTETDACARSFALVRQQPAANQR